MVLIRGKLATRLLGSKQELVGKFSNCLKASSHNSIFESDFLLKFKEVTDAKQYFCDLKQYQLNYRIRKLDRVNQPFLYRLS